MMKRWTKPKTKMKLKMNDRIKKEWTERNEYIRIRILFEKCIYMFVRVCFMHHNNISFEMCVCMCVFFFFVVLLRSFVRPLLIGCIRSNIICIMCVRCDAFGYLFMPYGCCCCCTWHHHHRHSLICSTGLDDYDARTKR